MARYYGCTWQKMDHQPLGESAVTKRENLLGQEWRRSRTEGVATVRRKSGVGEQGQNKKNTEGNNRSCEWGSERSIGSADRTEATVLGERAGCCTVVGVCGGGDTEKKDAHQAAQGKHIAPCVSLSQVVHTPLRTLKEPVIIVKTFLLQMNMSRNKERGPCSRRDGHIS